MKHLESQLQAACVRWFRYQYPQWGRFLIAIPNGSYLNGTPKQRSMQWSKLEREGAVAGVTDLILFSPNASQMPMFIEMKSPKGRMSEAQKDFEHLIVSNRYEHHVVYNFDEFQKVVEVYMARCKK